MDKKEIAIAFLIISSSLFLYWVRNAYFDTKEQLLVLTEMAFQSAIKNEVNIRMRNVQRFVQYSSSPSENSHSIDEKNDYAVQYYFTWKDPCRLSLDTLFRQELTDRQIQAQRGVRCIMGSQVYYSRTDSIFWEKAVQTSPVAYVSNYKITNEKEEGKQAESIELCAYIHFSFYSIVKHIPHIGWGLLLWAMLSCIIIFGFYFGKKKKQAVISIHVPTTGEWTKLTDELYFNERMGTLKYKDTFYQLKKNRLKLFTTLLHAPDYFLTREELVRQIPGRKVEETLSESDKAALYTTVRRLNNDLSDIPVIKIQGERENGYQLTIS